LLSIPAYGLYTDTEAYLLNLFDYTQTKCHSTDPLKQQLIKRSCAVKQHAIDAETDQ